ncbi:Exopolyphosphatase PRUNE1 [Nymphon striatum]|nr:Exopolyphosphatase PRUNE1 [Nymphon striatum]
MDSDSIENYILEEDEDVNLSFSEDVCSDSSFSEILSKSDGEGLSECRTWQQVTNSASTLFSRFPNTIVNVQKVGSCATLVAEKLLQSELNVINDDVALLLYVTIILDTVNLSPTAKKSTAKDVNILSMLKSHLGAINNDEWFRCLTLAKCDVKDLTAEQVLRKDLKSVKSTSLSIGIASIPISMQDFLSKDNAKLAVKNFCVDHGYQVLVMMTLTMDSEVRREIAIYSSFDSYREQVEDVIERSKNPSFQLEYVSNDMENMTKFEQKNVTASRKVLLPLLHKFLLGDDSPMSPMNVVAQNQSFSSLNING